jgi:hypothetical protein
VFDRSKYSNSRVNKFSNKSVGFSEYVFHKHLEKLTDLNNIITAIEFDIKETEEIIKTEDIDTLYDDIFTDKLITYRDNEHKLKELKNERRELELYILNR